MMPRIKTCRFERDRFFSVDHLLNSAVLVHHVPRNPVIDAQQSCRLPKANNFTVKRNSDCALLILRLIFGCFPLAIAWFVIAVIIDAIKRMVYGCFSHICEKLLKVITPLIADCDAATSVTVEMSGFRVIAAIFHAAPCVVGFVASRHAMRSSACSGYLCLETPAAITVSGSQIISRDGSDSAALTLANPLNLISNFNRILLENCPSSELLCC